MTTIALTAVHEVWDCRWSTNGHRLTGVPDAEQPESTWVCGHGGTRRNVSESECRTCSHWELAAGATARAIAAAPARARTMTTGQMLELSTRAVLVVTAAIFIATGAVMLSGPAWVPFTVSMWLCAAAFAGLAVFWSPSDA